MSSLVIAAPMQGWVAPLDEAPDAVFAGRMLGDGLAIDPTGQVLCAPCAGEVISVHRTRHAVTLRCANGAEILMHVGLDTVGLGGEGFETHVRDGQSVQAGDPLISFDIDLLAGRAKSLLTPVVVTNGEAFEIVRRQQDREARVGDFLMEVRPLARDGAVATAGAGPRASRRLVTPLAHGLHARPAARVADLAKRFDSEVEIAAFNRKANGKSPIGLMALAVRHGDEITVSAVGADAEAAVAAVADLIAGGMGEAAPTAAKTAVAAPELEREPVSAPLDLALLRGVKAAPGLAIGQAVRLVARDIAVPEAGAGVARERAALLVALDAVRTRLTEAASSGDRQRRAILGAHLAFLDDPELGAAAESLVAEGKSAGFAWRKAVGGYVEALRALGDARMAERVDDLVDLERQVLAAITGEDEGAGPALPQGAILLAEELLPSQLMALDAGRLAGLCTARGGPTSHVAILAAAMNIPALVAAGPGVMAIADGAGLILDADEGVLRVSPDAAALARAQTALAQREQRRASARAAAHEPARTADGARIEVFANLGSLADARAAVAAGAEGCGLLRTEFLFLDRAAPPDEDEQAAQYAAIAEALEGRPLIIRTLDVGGDKPVAYLPIPAEDNPALGLRGVRVGLWRPHILRTQLRAILRAAPAGQCKIMVPMIASLGELRAVRALLDEAKRDLGLDAPIQLGVMIETPAAAVTADILAAEADFLSIGTNDLTQYALAMDRGNPEVAARIDALHPAVLRLIARTAEGAARSGRWTGVCGGLASDLAAVPLLIGLGVAELSATPAQTPDVKARVRGLTLPQCRALAEKALALDSAEAVRALCAEALDRET